MIKKFLVVGKNLYLSSHRPDPLNNEGLAFELSMPTEEFWKLEKLLHEADYLLSSLAPKSDLAEVSKKVFFHCSKYAVHEKDRNWLSKRGTAGAGG